MEYPSLDKPKAGATRFNTDSSQLEIYDGNQWTGVLATSPEQQTGGTRGLVAGGRGGSPVAFRDQIDYVNLDSTGNAADFGNLTSAMSDSGGAASRTRGLMFAGQTSPSSPYANNLIDYITIASTGNATDFGDATTRLGTRAVSSSTRAIAGSGAVYTPSWTPTNIMDYVTIASTGNANDFGDLGLAAQKRCTFGSSTRGFWAGGYYPSNPNGRIEYVTIASTGNGTDFGDVYGGSAMNRAAACSNAIRGITFGDNSNTDNITYITMSSTGNAEYFGECAVDDANNTGMGAAASPVRAVSFGGGASPYAGTDRMGYVQIMTTGNAIDFGDLVVARASSPADFSNGHGGL